MSPADDAAALRSARARAASLAHWAAVGPAQRSRNAKKAFRRRFENVVDPDRTLPPDERAVLVDSAIKAYNAKLTYNRLRKRAEAADG